MIIGTIGTADSSATAQRGGTVVTCGIKLEVSAPHALAPNDGRLGAFGFSIDIALGADYGVASETYHIVIPGFCDIAAVINAHMTPLAFSALEVGRPPKEASALAEHLSQIVLGYAVISCF